MSELPEFVLNRVFDAPQEMVWRTWTDPELLARWYGPGVETIIHKFDLEPGGLWLGEMKWGDKSMLSKVVFQEVSPTEKLTWLHSSCDAEWNVISNPMMPDWPQTILTIVTLEQRGQKTHLRLTWIPHEASEAEIACFSGSVENMGKGWGSGFAIIDEILVELQAG